MFVFSKTPSIEGAGTPTLELDEGNASTFAKFKYEWLIERGSSKTERVFEKTNMISCVFFRRANTETY